MARDYKKMARFLIDGGDLTKDILGMPARCQIKLQDAIEKELVSMGLAILRGKDIIIKREAFERLKHIDLFESAEDDGKDKH